MVRVQRRGEALPLTHKEIKICFVFFAVFVSRDVQGEEINCQDLQRLTAQASLTVPVPSASQSDSPPVSLWYKPDASSDQTNAKLELKFGKYEFAVEKNKRSWRLSHKVSKSKVMESRVYYEWINLQGWARITLSSSRSGYGIEIGADQILDVHLGGLEMDRIDFIEISGASVTVSTACISTKERQRVSATTLPPTQTTTTIATTTTEPPTTEEPDTTTQSPDYETTIEEDSQDTDTHNSTSNPDPDIVVLPFASKKVLDGYECTNLPIWVWICVSVMVALFASSLILLACVVILYRRNKSLLAYSGNESKQGNVPPGRRLVSPGGYGQQSEDLQFIKPGNNDSIVAIAPPQPSLAPYTHTLNMPSGNQMAPNVRFSTGPRPCEYKRSTSCPDRSPSLSFPPPPATPPPERDETVPLFSPNGSVENNRTTSSSGRGRHSVRTSSTRRKRHVKEGFDADDESSTDN